MQTFHLENSSKSSGAVKNHQLMILTQHPQGVAVDTENIFTVFEEALQNNREYQQEKADVFLRVDGVKLPYAKRSFTLEQYRGKNPDSSALTYLPIDDEDESLSSLDVPASPQHSQTNSGFNIKLIFACGNWGNN